MSQSLTATTALACLFATTIMAGHNPAAVQSAPRPAVVHGRSTKFIEYNFEICPQVPSLHCRNGSTCAPGIADFGKHDHLDLRTDEHGYYCKCPPGFIGHECEIEVEDCDVGTQSDPQACYHGSNCRSSGGDSYCDCEKLNESSDPTDRKFAGPMCEHESTSLCAVSLVGQHAPNHQFCTNHGTCVKFVSGGEPHPGCICKSGWMGNHCEIRTDPFAATPVQKSEEGGGNSVAGKVGLSLVIIAVVAMVIGVGLMLVRAKSKADAESSTSHLPAVFQGATGPAEMEATGGAERTVLGEGDLEPDGSATLGSSIAGDTDEHGELLASDEDRLETRVV